MAALALAFALAGAAHQATAARAPDPLEASLRRQIAVLASDDFGGREPGTEGETKTLRYLAGQWFDLGLESGTNDPGHAWFAPVRLIEHRSVGWRAQFATGPAGARRRIAADAKSALVVTSGLRSLVDNVPLLYVGDGGGKVPARQELAGRVALILDSARASRDPAAQDERVGKLLDGGASGVLTVLDGQRTIDEVRARRARSGYALSDEKLGGDLVGFMTRELAAQVFGEGELAAMRRAGGRAGFTSRLTGVSTTLEAQSRNATINTHNLIGRIPGRNPAAGAVLLVAHWDHFGTCAEPPAPHLVCNGAVDNASGLAVITEVARQLAQGKPLQRDVYVLATSAEEYGLLGALAFAENPPIPLGNFVAAFNVDTDAIAPAGAPFTIVGRGRSGLDGEIEKVIRRQGRKLDRSDIAEHYVRRQDGWVLLQHDVPAVMVSTAYSDGPRFERFMETRYHRPADQATDDLELGGAADDVRMIAALVRDFADPAAWPGRPLAAPPSAPQVALPAGPRTAPPEVDTPHR